MKIGQTNRIGMFKGSSLISSKNPSKTVRGMSGKTQKALLQKPMTRDFLQISDLGRQLAGSRIAEKSSRDTNPSGIKNQTNVPSAGGLKIQAQDNKVILRDPFVDALTKYYGSPTISKNGTMSWGGSADIVSAKELEAEIFGNMSRDDYNFWSRLANKDTTFLSLNYDTEEVRSRLKDAGVKTGFFSVTMGDRTAEHFLSQGKSAVAVYSRAEYDEQYKVITGRHFLDQFEVGHVFRIEGKEYTLGEDRKLDIPYGKDIWTVFDETVDKALASKKQG